MLRFDRQRPPTQQRASVLRVAAEQRRLRFLILALAIVLVAIWRAGDPQTWTALLGPVETSTHQATPIAATERVEPAAPVTLLPGIDAEALRPVEDGTVFRSNEHDAWWNLWQALLEDPLAATSTPPARHVTHGQLRGAPQAYRGALVRLTGTIRRAALWPAQENKLGLTSFVRLWLWPDQEQSPVVVYTPSLPAQFPWEPSNAPSESLEVPVRVTGVFFKNLLYRSGEGPRLAPVVLAPSIVVTSEGAPTRRGIPESNRWRYLLICGLLCTALGWTSWRLSRSLRRTIPLNLGIVLVLGTSPASAAELPLRSWLESAGIADEAWQELQDGPAFSTDERTTLQVLFRSRRFALNDWQRWRQATSGTWSACITKPSAWRGAVLALEGQAQHVHRFEFDANSRGRWELDRVFVVGCQMPGVEQPVWVVTAEIPQAWQEVEELNEPVSADVVFLRMGRATREGELGPLVVTPRLAWHPTAYGDQGLALNRGQLLLSQQGMDIGQFDQLEQRSHIGGEDREAFYQMLHAVGRIDVADLHSAARQNLAELQSRWKDELATLSDQEDDRARRSLLTQAVESARLGRFSVYPLFNAPQAHVGELVLLIGTVRRAQRIELSSPLDPSINADVRQRFGIDHYYELEMFTADSRNNPVVCCVRELPAGFRPGAWIHEDVSVAGFFCKSWAYHVGGESGKQLAPLVIAPTVLPWQPAQVGDSWGLVAGLVAVSLIGVVSLILWIIARRDTQYQRRAFESRYAPSSGISLNDLTVSDSVAPHNGDRLLDNAEDREPGGGGTADPAP